MAKIIVGVGAVALVTGGVWWYMGGGETEQTITERFEEAVAEPFVDTSPIPLATSTIEFSDGSTASFQLAEGFTLSVAAEDLGKARFMAWSPDNRLFVPDIVDYNLSHEGRLFVLEGFNEETGQFATKHTYLSGLRGPNSVAFYTDPEGRHWLYLALTAHLVRYPYSPGDTEPSGEPEIILEFPNQQSPGEVSVVWHITRTIFFHEGRLYVSVGSGCNACEELAGDMRAMIYSTLPDGSDQRVEGIGLRNTVGIAMADNELYATANGVDHLGNAAPEEMMYKVENGQHYGWPYCYVENGQHVPDTTYNWAEDFDCDSVPSVLTSFAPRSAPLGLRFFPLGSHRILGGSFLVALHGSFEAAVRSGYEIVRVTKNGQRDLFMSGFMRDGERIARPVDFLIKDENSFFFTDDHGGRIFYVKTVAE